MNLPKEKLNLLRDELKTVYMDVAESRLDDRCSKMLLKVEEDICSAISWIDMIMKQAERQENTEA